MKNQSNSVGHSFCRVAVVSAAGFVCGVGAAFADITPKETASATRLEIQNAIDAAAVANPVGTVTLGNGTFEIDAQLMVTGGVTLVGQGWANTIIKQTTSGSKARCATVSDGARLVGVTLTGGRLTEGWKHGAGVDLDDGTVSWCRITDNKCTARNSYGGGVHINKGTVDHCIIDSNQAGTHTSGGGGIGTFSTLGPVVIDTCLVYDNTASVTEGDSSWSGGGGLGFFQSTPNVTIRNTTVVGNSAKGLGGGLRTVGDKVKLLNCIVSGNEAESDDEIHGSLESGSANNIVGGNLSSLFVDADNADYHLYEESPAIRAGSAYEGIGNDLDNQAFASTPSIGCYEYLGVLLVARPVFTPATDTTFSPSVYVTLSCPTDGAEIYYTTNGSDPTDSSTPYNGSIYIANNITIKARAYKSGMSPSRIVTAEYTLGTPTSPEFGTVSVDPKAMVATISGEIVSVGNNLATSCDVYLALGSDYGSYGERTLVVQGATTSFSYVIPNLVPERTYYYELTIVNNAQSEMSASTQGSFTTTPREQVQPVKGDAAATRSRIQEAIDAAVLEVPAGTVALAAELFEIDAQLMVTGGVTLVGQGWGNTIIKQAATTAAADKRVMTIDGGSTVERLTITGGKVTGSNEQIGGGALILDGTISWCCITNNSVFGNNTKYGGGIGFYLGHGGQIDHSIVADNLASTQFGDAIGGGGIGVYKPFGPVTVESCLVWGNRTVLSREQDNRNHMGRGGGIGVDMQLQNNPVSILNTTIVGNSAGEEGSPDGLSKGGAVFTTGDSKSKFAMTNCIVACNTTVGTNITMSLSYAGGVDYCFFDVADDKLGANSKTGDPMFFSVERGNFKLRGASPCIDAGFAGDWMTSTSRALDGNPRIMGRGPDMGCYETCHMGFAIRLR